MDSCHWYLYSSASSWNYCGVFAIMRKKLVILSLFFLSFFFLLIAPKTSAATFSSGLEDNLQLFGGNVTLLEQEAQKLANETKAGVYVVTTDSSTPASQMAKTYLADKVGAKNNGVVLVINMNLRKVYIWATGNLKYYLPSSRIEKTLDIVQPELTDNNYYQAVSGFFDQVSKYYQAGIPTSRKYSINSETGAVTFHRSFQPLSILIALIISLIAAGGFVWTIYRRYQMKDAHAVWRYDYGRNGNLELHQREDILVNTFITTRIIPRPSSDNNNFSDGSGGGRSF